MLRLATFLIALMPLVAQLNTSSPLTQANDYQTSLNVQPGQTATLTSATVKNGRLWGVDVWSSTNTKAMLYVVTNGTTAANPSVVGGQQAFTTWNWVTPAAQFVVTGNTAGQDAFQILITNLGQQGAADVYVVFHYSL